MSNELLPEDRDKDIFELLCEIRDELHFLRDDEDGVEAIVSGVFEIKDSIDKLTSEIKRIGDLYAEIN